MEEAFLDYNNRRIVNLAILYHNAVWVGKKEHLHPLAASENIIFVPKND